jgi:hypothetical protein
MPNSVIRAIRFRPPVAVARLGDSDSPLEAFSWAEDIRMFGGARTIIKPVTSLEVLPDGAVEPYRPRSIRFRDGNKIRPVCPFLELEAVLADGTHQALTTKLMERAGLSLSQVYFRVVAANLKAQRQTGDTACGFEARLQLRGDDHNRHNLLAWSAQAGERHPLVSRERPIWLGNFQVIRPLSRKKKFGVNTETLRVRFTPGRGAVYGPPSADRGQAKQSRAMHTIVPEENRILNPNASWPRYNVDTAKNNFPLPGAIYDGYADLDTGDVCLGVVDDACDAVITASLSPYFEDAQPPAPTAYARVLCGPPHFAPDRRHLYSFVEDLADRDPGSLHQSELTPGIWLEAVSDLFRRIWETASTVNLDRHRTLNLSLNKGQRNISNFPAIHETSMTGIDRVNRSNMMSARFIALAGQDEGDVATGAPLLSKAEYARMRHAELSVPRVLLEYMVQNPRHFREILRPPFRRPSDPRSRDVKPEGFRDPTSRRSYVFDARMPPFIRDSDFSPLSLTRHQYDLLFARNRKGLLMKQAWEALNAK